TRVADTQKCLRVSGKHNDLDEVGHDTYHHTLFEMLGNWSFGDYFKAEAIAWAWELLTERWGLDPKRLYVTVHEGDAGLGLSPDDEAADLWRQQPGLQTRQILPGSTKDNFWMMGDTGPCGPCTEVHVDLRPDDERQRVDGAALVNTGDPRVIEIWNLVFIQYNAQADGSLVPLPAKHVDTGMGFERVVAALQGAASNYDTDVFTPLLNAAAALSPRAEVRGYDDLAIEDATEKERVRVALRVVGDHLRAVSFAIADGVLPGNTGRGYVIRRILRRAVRYGYQTLDLREPFLVRLVPVLADHMGDAFPELRTQQGYIERVVRAEEEAFLETLGTGLQAFGLVVPHLEILAAQAEMPGPDDAALDALRRDTRTMDFLGKAYGASGVTTPDEVVRRFTQSAAEREVPGEVAFLLHDTYGFPVDLTALMAREVSLGVGMAAYDHLMQQQKTRARAAGGFKVDLSLTEDWTPVHGGDGSVFVGYDRLAAETRIVAVRTVEAGEGSQRHEVVLEETPFYAESGGQVADTGVLRIGGEEVAVLDVQLQAGRVIHVVERLPDDLTADVTAQVDASRRRRIQAHHTATHLLHSGLRHVLGKHVAQKGSLVAPDRLRFDFSHFERVTPDQLREVERYVNAFIQDNVARREDRDVPIQEALARGAMALFGEKYGERVRVITFDEARSVELCGGTHAGATGEIGVFRFVAEGSVAAGIRRVEALAGQDALESLWRDLDDLAASRTHFRGLKGHLSAEVEALIEQNRRLERSLEESRLAMLQDRLEGIAQRAEVVKDTRLASGRMDGASMDALRELAQRLQQRLGDGGVALLAGTDETGTKALLAVAVSNDLVARGVQAGKLVGVLAKHVGGGGGGRPNVATAGGRDPQGLEAALAAAPGLVADLLG
ncbi:MAG TPA: alanine--tRNA ligase, partial [Rhodothermales bacterium]|nr:alanine--tRNA ligase [Rhodothermales bacterium]